MLKTIPLQAFEDNYIWIIHSLTSNRVIAIDPGDGKIVSKYLNEHQLQLAAILITHHHEDHTGGIAELRTEYNAPVYGPETNLINGISHPLKSEDMIELLDFWIKVIAAPGHTQDHLLYLFESDAPHLFCGDTLFSAGCGRLFEGTAEQMLNTLAQINSLPGQTLLYPAHEYTLANLVFAATVEPGNKLIKPYRNKCLIKIAEKLPTLPVTLSVERQVNPFLRTSNPEIARSAHTYAGQYLATEIEVFTWLRRWKDNF